MPIGHPVGGKDVYSPRADTGGAPDPAYLKDTEPGNPNPHEELQNGFADTPSGGTRTMAKWD